MAGQQFTEQPPLNAPIQKPTVPQPEVPAAAKPVEPSPSSPKIEVPKMSSNDILKRTQEKPQESPKPQESSYREDLDKITDPAVKVIAEKAIKDFESGYNKKYQDLATQRKELEGKLNQISTWTPQRLAEELRKPEFVQAMQTLQQQSPPQGWDGSSDEWSALSNTEKAQFQQMRQETQSLQSQMQRMLQSQEDIKIKEQYPEYNPAIVDEAIEGLRTGQITPSRSDIWKVVEHDNNVQKGYQFGYEDGYKKALEKLNGNSIIPSNGSMTPADDVPEDIKSKGFASIAGWRLSRLRNGNKK